jgi:outer membrane protein OmpA-like peptidoglycan-associated protein
MQITDTLIKFYFMKKLTSIILPLFMLTIIISCSNLNKTQKGVIIGTAGGAAVGGAIGSIGGKVGLGAIIGAAAGGVAGGIIGNKMDKQAADIQKDIPSANVERVGEGIVVEFSDKILFSINRSDLSAEARTNLDKLSAILVKYPDTNIEIQGHTDNTGTNSLNQTLSEKRAMAVNNYLTSLGISSSRLTVKGYGEDLPKYSNETEEGRMQNRNVQFLIAANEKMKEAARKEAAATGK